MIKKIFIALYFLANTQHEAATVYHSLGYNYDALEIFYKHVIYFKFLNTAGNFLIFIYNKFNFGIRITTFLLNCAIKYKYQKFIMTVLIVKNQIHARSYILCMTRQASIKCQFNIWHTTYFDVLTIILKNNNKIMG